MTRECVGCGKAFDTGDLRKRVCKKGCGRNSQSAHRTRTLKRLAHHVQFIAVDGEADTTLPGDPYVLLSVGDQSLHKEGRRLTHHDIFPFLWEQHLKNPTAAFVGFFLTYDFSQWLRSITEHEARMLLDPKFVKRRKRTKSGGNPKPFPVYVGKEWEIDILGLKRLKLRPQGSETSWMYICDVGPFFQTSLLNAINPKEWGSTPVCTPEEYDIIREGKTTRNDAQFGEEMIRYNVLENTVLARMMARLNEGFTAIDVRLPRDSWYGPGQAAQAWMKGVKAPVGQQVKESLPQDVITMAIASYYGGWFEVFQHGHIPGTTYEYDINSAYPHIMRSLPCLLHGQWAHGKEKSPYVLVQAIVTGTDPYVGAMQHRDSKERIFRPGATMGTYWLHEVEAAKRAGIVSSVKVVDAWTYHPCDCPPPLGGVQDLYQQRLDVGKETVHGKACKLAYNAMYGKMAQSIGKPIYANPVYASLITSGCRTMILDAIASHPTGTADLVMVATDGVYFRTPHNGLERDRNRLGAWGESALSNLTILKPGVYWSDKNRDSVKRQEGLKLKSRGVSARDLAKRMEEFDTLFHEWEPTKPWPSLTVDIAFRVIGPNAALHRNAWDLCGKAVRNDTVVVSSDPSLKRDAQHVKKRDGAWTTPPYDEPPSGRLESLPYQKEFGMGDDFGDGITPDGGTKSVVMSLWTH